MKLTDELAELVGVHIGDGCLSDNGRYRECAVLGDLTEEIDYYESHLVPMFNRVVANPLIGNDEPLKRYESSNVCGIISFKGEIFEFYKSLGLPVGSKINVKIPKRFLKKKLVRHVLRGLFDTDGNLYFDVNRSAKERVNKFPIIYLTSTSEKLILQVFDILISRGYSPSLKKPHKGKRDKNPKHRVVIYRKSDVFRFVEKDIGFSNPKHLLKWEFFKKYGYYIPNISYEERKRLLKQKIL